MRHCSWSGEVLSLNTVTCCSVNCEFEPSSPCHHELEVPYSDLHCAELLTCCVRLNGRALLCPTTHVLHAPLHSSGVQPGLKPQFSLIVTTAIGHSSLTTGNIVWDAHGFLLLCRTRGGLGAGQPVPLQGVLPCCSCASYRPTSCCPRLVPLPQSMPPCCAYVPLPSKAAQLLQVLLFATSSSQWHDAAVALCPHVFACRGC